MLNKSIKIAFLTALSVALLFACSNEKEATKENKNESTTQSSFKGIDFSKIYEMDDNKTLVKLGDAQLTVGDLKRQTFEQSLLISVTNFIDSNLFMQKYKVTKEELAAEIARQKEAVGANFNEATVDEEAIRYQLAYNKAIESLVEYTEEDLKKIYTQYYEGKDSRSYEEMKEYIEKQAPYILGREQLDKLKTELRKEAKVEFNEESLMQQFNLSIEHAGKPEEKPSN